MKKTYDTPVIDIVKFSNADRTNARILVSGTFRARNNTVEIPDGVGSNSATNMFDF